MEFEGTVWKILPKTSGVSARGEWTKQEIIFEQKGEFGRKICVSFWGDKAEEAASLREGDPVTVSANVESREFNGRWYTDVRAWKLSRLAAAPAAMPPREQPALDGQREEPAAPWSPSGEDEATSKDEFDDLPF